MVLRLQLGLLEPRRYYLNARQRRYKKKVRQDAIWDENGARKAKKSKEQKCKTIRMYYQT